MQIKPLQQLPKKHLLMAAGLVVALLAMLIVYQYIQSLTTSKPSETIDIAEQKLLTPQTVAVFYADIERSLSLAETEGDLLSQAPKMSVGNPLGFLQKLNSAGAPIHKQAEKLLLVAEAASTEASRTTLDVTLVLTGQFNPEKLASAIKQNALTTAIAKNAHVYRVTPPEDVETCGKVPNLDISIQQDNIIITAEGKIKQALKKLTNPKNSDHAAPWKPYRQNKLFAAAIFNPELAKKQIKEPMTRMMLAQAPTKDFTKTYFGAEVSLMDRGVALNLQSWTTAEQAKELATNAQEKRDGFVKLFPKEPASIQFYKDILESMEFDASGNKLTFNMAISGDQISQMSDIQNQIATLIQSQFKFQSTTESESESTEPKEDILADPRFIPYYQNNADIDNIDTSNIDQFSQDLGEKFGPFRVLVSAEAQSFSNRRKQSDSTLFVHVKSGIIPNIPTSMHSNDENARAKVTIQRVENSQGNNILKLETCGKDRNNKPQALPASTHTSYQGDTAISQHTVQGEKALRLADGYTTDDAQMVHGFLELRIANIIQEDTVPATTDKPFKVGKALVHIEKAEYNNLTYKLEDPEGQILNVLPLSGKKQVLKANTKSKSGDSITQYASGTPQFVKVIYSTQEQSRTYPFKLEVKRSENP
ncbi:MAG: hypothetical protein VX154_00150 [Pseudomonadota bacterium]|nr:hypothetical protein [Pseudomonadota bacterium]